MRDSYLVDEKVGEIVDQLEKGLLSSSQPTALHEALCDAHEATDAPVSKIAASVAKMIRVSDRMDQSARASLASWIDKHYVTRAWRR